jgi:mono/diheme cytochrome c family protein
MRITTFLAISFLAFATLALRAQDASKPKESVYTELEKVPDKNKRMKNPLANDPDAAAAGRVLFEEHCEECHGKAGMGGRKAPSLRTEEVQNAAPGAIFWILANGVVRKRMPVWSKLPDPQRWQLVSFIKSMGAAGTGSDTAKTP